MRRRSFISHIALQTFALSVPGTLYAMGENREGKQFGTSSRQNKTITKIGNRSLEDIREVFRHELFDITLPLWKKDGVDWKYGGYLPHIDENGNITTTNKSLYYQGRVLWLYSYFYNMFDNDERFLLSAKTGFDFLTKYCVDDKYDWFTEVTREGEPITKFFDIYASIYTILGLGEYYKATGIEEACDIAVKSAYRANEIILSPHYQAQGHGPYYEPGTKRLGTWLHFLNALTPLLKYTEDSGVEKIARMCVRNMLQYHWQPDLGVAFEILQPNFLPHPNDFFIDEETKSTQNRARWVNNFHTMEAAWMIMEEALRVGNTGMFRAGMDFGRVHIEKGWVDRGSEKGLVQFYMPDYPETLEKNDIIKPYVFKEMFILLLLALEHDPEADWAAEWFDKSFGYAYDAGLEWPWRDTLHQPRGVMYCYEILGRMIERNGKASDFFDNAS